MLPLILFYLSAVSIGISLGSHKISWAIFGIFLLVASYLMVPKKKDDSQEKQSL